MTSTADRIHEALVCDDAFTAELGGDGAWVDILADEVPFTAPFSTVALRVDAPPNLVEALVYPNETAERLSQLVPSAALVEVLDVVTPAMLEVDGQIDALVAVERHIGWLQARSAELLAALEVTSAASKDGFTRDHVAAALRLPPASMRDRMSTARELTERLPATLNLLRAGEITQRHAVDLAEATTSLTPESVATVEAAVLARAPEQTVAQFRAAVRRAVLKVSSPVEQEKAHADAREQRRVIITPVEDGMAELWAFLPADEAAQIKAILDAMAHETIHGKGGDTRTADQRRTDALVQLASAALADPHLAKAHGQRPAVQVTVAASTLLGLDEQPAELDGYGPITAAMARMIAFDPTATWRLFLTDDCGRIQRAGSKTYRPCADMTRTVIARDVHCVYPGCRRKAVYTDLDHIEAWRDGDQTTEANLISLCRRHHRFKHSGEWTVHRDDRTGITTWTDRKGRQYKTRPPTQPTTTTAPASDETETANTPESESPPANTESTDQGPLTAAIEAAVKRTRSAVPANTDSDLPPF